MSLNHFCSLGPSFTEEEIEDARNLVDSLDPTFLINVADKIAELAQIENKARVLYILKRIVFPGTLSA